MLIAYHNPWANSAENQGFMSMAEAGRRIGIEVVACSDETQIETCRPDFVLSVASSMAKITDYPTYLTVHEPKALLLEQPQRRRNLFSYDGYLTISDSLRRFVKDLCYGIGRDEEPGFCYLTPQINELRTDWDRPDLAETLKMVYFGTNWNRRMPLLFRALDPMGILRIHGPEGSWKSEAYTSYAGPVAFDGAGPQRVYAECGIGLALMDERWLREDVISNRIFEISSVGAVSICPDMPWTRKWFGDSVLYFDASRPMREIARQVHAHHAFCAANPGLARGMGEAARRIFEEHFAAERMLRNAVDYHTRKTEERARRRAAMAPAPRICVVVRCGGRSIDIVRRAVNSIRTQTFGSFTVILAKYRDIDLTPLTSDISGAITGFVEFLLPGGSRTQMLWAGLGRITSPYFAVLDDDDFWLSDHFEEMFRVGRLVREDFDMAFSGTVDFDFPTALIPGTAPCSRNISRFGFDIRIVDAWQISGAIGTNCFVARSDLLTGETRPVPDMRTAEDSVLISLAARRSKPIFSWRPTAFYRRDAADGSDWQNDAQRTEDEISFALRAGLAWAPQWLASASFEMPDMIWAAAKSKPAGTAMGEQLDRLTAGSAGEAGPSGIAARKDVVGPVCLGPFAKLAPGRYQAIFLIAPTTSTSAAPASRLSLGEVDIAVAAPGGGVLARRGIDSQDQEITLRFGIDEKLAFVPLEFRVLSRGVSPFTVASVGLHQDLTDPKTLAQPSMAASGCEGLARSGLPYSGIAELEAQIEALRASTSWRLTAPLRWLARRHRSRRE